MNDSSRNQNCEQNESPYHDVRDGQPFCGQWYRDYSEHCHAPANVLNQRASQEKMYPITRATLGCACNNAEIHTCVGEKKDRLSKGQEDVTADEK